jgi:tetrahydromethanopterin S-methyltransferase subunit F
VEQQFRSSESSQNQNRYQNQLLQRDQQLQVAPEQQNLTDRVEQQFRSSDSSQNQNRYQNQLPQRDQQFQVALEQQNQTDRVEQQFRSPDLRKIKIGSVGAAIESVPPLEQQHRTDRKRTHQSRVPDSAQNQNQLCRGGHRIRAAPRTEDKQIIAPFQMDRNASYNIEQIYRTSVLLESLICKLKSNNTILA